MFLLDIYKKCRVSLLIVVKRYTGFILIIFLNGMSSKKGLR